MKDIPNAQEAQRLAKAAAAAPKFLTAKAVQQITKAIDAGELSTVLEYDAVGDWSYTQSALRSRGYTVKTVQTGINESGLKVSWGMTDAETSEAYYTK